LLKNCSWALGTRSLSRHFIARDDYTATRIQKARDSDTVASPEGARAPHTCARRPRSAVQKNLLFISALEALPTKEHVTNRKELMLWTIFVILLVLWLLGLVSSYTLGGFIHILLVLAIVVLIINLIQGRRSL
jgi:hypothetical protein